MGDLVQLRPESPGDDGDHNPDREIFPPPSDPMAVACRLLPEWEDAGRTTVLSWRGQWMEWQRTHWVEIDPAEVRSRLYKRLQDVWHYNKKGELERWAPAKNKIGNLIEAVAACVHLDKRVDAPAWLDGAGTADGPIVACENGLLDVPTSRLLDHDPRYLNLVSVPFAYDPAAPEPARWLWFLEELWPDEPGSVDALQEWFGYVLSGRTDLQKMLLMIGPTRSGKGTIAAVLGELIGRANVAAPTLSAFATNFGLWPLIGKPLAVIGDARPAGAGSHQVVERLLTISGEDTITIDRKYLEPWTGKLPTRIMILSNELPNFGDSSGTIAHRFIALQMSRSWLGKEDVNLGDDLRAELPGILNWALDGLALLDKQGRFSEPEDMSDVIVTLKESASPMSAFVRERCEVGPYEVLIDALWSEWRDWCAHNGQRAGTKQSFGKDLRAVIPGIRDIQHRKAGARARYYRGVRVPARDDDAGTARDDTRTESVWARA